MFLITKTGENGQDTPLEPRRNGPDLAALAEAWLTLKTVGDRMEDAGHSARARRADLVRWAAGYMTVLNPARNRASRGSGLDAWSTISAGSLADPVNAVAVLGLLAADGLALASRQRMLATLRGWCGWLARRGYLDSDPTAADEVRLRGNERDLDGKAFTIDDVAELVKVAGQPLGLRERSPWPARDVAIVSILAGCGLRVSELCGLTIRLYDTTGEQALVRIRDAKGGKGRTVPVPRDTVVEIDRYLVERTERTVDSPMLEVSVKARLFVTNDGKLVSQQFIDVLLRRLCGRAGIAQPDGAMAHALRHHYGTQLALRGVPLPVIQQLLGHRNPATTSIYTRATALDTAGVLEDAGWL